MDGGDGDESQVPDCNGVDGGSSPEMGIPGGEEVGGKLRAMLGFSCLGWAVRRWMGDKLGLRKR